jgi:hypothetical protein
VTLNTDSDMFRWNLTNTGLFSVQSMYRALMTNGNVAHSRIIWKMRSPLRIKIFMWYLHRGIVLTKDNLVKRNWHGSERCCFCSDNETTQHLFFDCHVAKFLWRLVHITFGLQPPTSFIHMFGTWLNGVSANLKRHMLLGASAIC